MSNALQKTIKIEQVSSNPSVTRRIEVKTPINMSRAPSPNYPPSVWGKTPPVFNDTIPPFPIEAMVRRLHFSDISSPSAVGLSNAGSPETCLPPPPPGFPFLNCGGSYVSYGYVVTAPYPPKSEGLSPIPVHQSTPQQDRKHSPRKAPVEVYRDPTGLWSSRGNSQAQSSQAHQFDVYKDPSQLWSSREGSSPYQSATSGSTGAGLGGLRGFSILEASSPPMSAGGAFQASNIPSRTKSAPAGQSNIFFYNTLKQLKKYGGRQQLDMSSGARSNQSPSNLTPRSLHKTCPEICNQSRNM